jgi:cytochrome c553
MDVNMKFSINALFITLLTMGVAHAGETRHPNGGDAKAGKDKSALCQGCHGEVGMSVAPNFPNLAGQYPQYIERQIHSFQDEKRVDPTMSGMAATITEPQDLKDIAAYFGSQKPMAGKHGGNKDLVAKGKAIFTDGIPDRDVYGCKNCHGENGHGRAPDVFMFPVIGGQNKDYLLKQLKDFRSGERHNDPAGMMGGIASKLKDAEIDALVEYISEM